MRAMRVEFVIPKKYLKGCAETNKVIARFDTVAEYSVNKGDTVMMKIPNCSGVRTLVVLSTEDVISDKSSITHDRIIYRSINVVPIDESIEWSEENED